MKIKLEEMKINVVEVIPYIQDRFKSLEDEIRFVGEMVLDYLLFKVNSPKIRLEGCSMFVNLLGRGIVSDNTTTDDAQNNRCRFQIDVDSKKIEFLIGSRED